MKQSNTDDKFARQLRGTKMFSDFLKQGKAKETNFKDLFNNTEWSTKEQDKMEHWDFKVNFKVDVKGLKKFRRSDKHPNENIHWIEIKNVFGHHGWLYGDADLFAFETNKYWIVVEKYKLQEWIAKNISKQMVSTPEMYKLYQRHGSKDIITLVSSHDLYYLSLEIIQKN
jgi:hypothetical protein